MSNNDVPASPDYSGYLNAFQGIADSAKAAGAESLAWAKEQVASNKDLLNQVNGGLLDLQSTFGTAAKDALARGTAITTEATQNLRDQYDKYTDPNRKAASMGAAGAQAAQANEAARKASMAELESYGLNPGAVRYAGLDAGMRLQDAATRVGAENIAGRQDDALANQTNAQLLQQGNVVTGQGNANAATGSGAGAAAVGGANSTTSTGGGVLGTGLQWTGAGTNAIKGAVDTQDASYKGQLKRSEQENSQSSGVGSLLGLGASMLGKGGAMASGGALSGVGTALASGLAFLEEGGAVDDIEGMGGGAVPIEMSPSDGAAIDDVDAVSPGGPAKLNAGEFVLPEDVTSWYGEKFMQNLIMKARKEKGEAGAKPKSAPSGPSPADPAFQPRPQASQGALPV